MKNVKVTAIIACAGSGVRAKQNQNKIFAEILGVPVVLKTVSAFDRVKRIDEILIVHGEGEDAKLKEILAEIKKPVSYVLGGKTRFQSIKNALDVVSDGIVLIHDGARPFIEESDIEACVKTVLVHGSAVLATALTDTVLETDGSDVIFASDRKGKLSALTPQCFNLVDIRNAYAHASESDGYTDDAGIYCATFGNARRLSPKTNVKSLPTKKILAIFQNTLNAVRDLTFTNSLREEN